MRFDNRSSKLTDGVRRSEHFAFEVNQKKIVYCYIRKNASSSFKRLIISRSPQKSRRGEFPSSLKFLSRFHTTKIQQFEGFDHSIIVVRDPVDRLLSVYRNKFVQRTGHTDIFESYAKVTGKNPETATFSDFVTEYIGRPFSELDVHVRPQYDSLLPTVYSDAIPLDCLHARMTEIIGSELADRFFLPQVNSTSDASSYYLESAYLVPSEDLHRTYREKNEFPDKECLLSAEIRQKIVDIYAIDLEVFSRASNDSQV